MALIKWSGIGIVDGRGKINGSVLSKNKAGAIARTWVKPANPNSSFQSQIRSQMSGLSSAWRGLTAVQRSGWDSAAGSGDWPFTNKLGETKNPSGFQLYMRLNLSLDSAGFPTIADVPNKVALSAVTITASVFNISGAVYDDFGVTLSGSISADERVVVGCSGGVSAGRGSWFNFKSLGAFVLTGSNDVAISSEYDARFGFPSAGQKIFAQLFLLNTTTGQRSQIGVTSAIVFSI